MSSGWYEALTARASASPVPSAEYFGEQGETVMDEKKYELNGDQLEHMAGGAAYKEESVPAAGCLRRFIKGRSYVL